MVIICVSLLVCRWFSFQLLERRAVRVLLLFVTTARSKTFLLKVSLWTKLYELFLHVYLKWCLCVFYRWRPLYFSWACVRFWRERASYNGRGPRCHCGALCPFQLMQPSLCATENACHQKQNVSLITLYFSITVQFSAVSINMISFSFWGAGKNIFPPFVSSSKATWSCRSTGKSWSPTCRSVFQGNPPNPQISTSTQQQMMFSTSAPHQESWLPVRTMNVS